VTDMPTGRPPMADYPFPLYEHADLRSVTGETLRPGGFTLTDRAMGFCGLPKRGKVLDVGCGTGASVTRLRSRHRLEAFGLDPSAALLKEGHEKDAELPLVRATASSLPVGDARLRAILCECVLSLTADPLAVLREFHRALRAGGSLILSDLYLRSAERAGELSDLPGTSCLSGALGQAETEARVAECGFTVLLWEDHSELLKDLAVRFIFAHGSLRSLWAGICAKGDAAGISQTVRLARPGYYLLIAKKG
jgi:arsenite methyltransferase